MLGKVPDFRRQPGPLQIEQIRNGVLGARQDDQIKILQTIMVIQIVHPYPRFLLQGIKVRVIGNVRQANNPDVNLASPGIDDLPHFTLQGHTIFLGQQQVFDVGDDPQDSFVGALLQ